MKITLNTKRCGILFLTNLPPLTIASPGPIEVDVASLTHAQLRQIQFNSISGNLILDPLNALEISSVTPVPVQTKSPSSPAKGIENFKTEKNTFLLAILNKNMDTIKKTLPSLSISDLRLLETLEKENKNRKSVLKLTVQLIEDFTQKVSSSLPQKSTEKESSDSTNVSIVVESEKEQVTVQLPEKE